MRECNFCGYDGVEVTSHNPEAHAAAMLTAAEAVGKYCTFDCDHVDRPAVAIQHVSGTGETFYVCERCALDLGFYEE